MGFVLSLRVWVFLNVQCTPRVVSFTVFPQGLNFWGQYSPLTGMLEAYCLVLRGQQTKDGACTAQTYGK